MRKFVLVLCFSLYASACIAGQYTLPADKTALDIRISQNYKTIQANMIARFVNNGNGTMTDRETGLIWMTSYLMSGARQTPDEVVSSYQNGTNYGSWKLTDGSERGDWRLPTRSELLEVTRALLVATDGRPQWPNKPFTHADEAFPSIGLANDGYILDEDDSKFESTHKGQALAIAACRK